MARSHALQLMSSMFAVRSHYFLRWLSHVTHMPDGCIPKDVLYRELSIVSWPTGRPFVLYEDICKWDLRASNINHKSWETLANDRTCWRQAVKAGTLASEKQRELRWEEKWKYLLQRVVPAPTGPKSDHVCSKCNKVCSSRIGLLQTLQNNHPLNDWPQAQTPLSSETDGCQQQKEIIYQCKWLFN